MPDFRATYRRFESSQSAKFSHICRRVVRFIATTENGGEAVRIDWKLAHDVYSLPLHENTGYGTSTVVNMSITLVTLLSELCNPKMCKSDEVDVEISTLRKHHGIGFKDEEKVL